MNRISAAVAVALSFVATNEAAKAQDGVELGVATLVLPAHIGADDDRVIVLPTIDARSGPLFANLQDGAGADLRLGPITIGAAATYVIGYRSSDAPPGIGRLADAAAARVFARTAVGGAIVTLGANKEVIGGTGGWTGDATMLYPVPLSDRVMIAPSIGIDWGDRRRNDRYFGVDAGQALASGLALYRPGAGFNSVSAGVTARYRVSNRLALHVGAKSGRLLGSVSRSPIVDDTTLTSFTIGLTYRP